jgi:hypothetical protein
MSKSSLIRGEPCLRQINRPQGRMNRASLDPNTADSVRIADFGSLMERQDDVLKKLSALAPARVYADDQDSYAKNDLAITWQSALVFFSLGNIERWGNIEQMTPSQSKFLEAHPVRARAPARPDSPGDWVRESVQGSGRREPVSGTRKACL